MDEEDAIPSVNFIPCVKWIRRGVAVARPTKVELTKQEIENVIKQTRANLRVNDEEADSGTENEIPATNDEYGMETYDEDEGDRSGLGVDNVVSVDEDRYNPIEDEIDSEEEDDIIKPTDNLIAVGHVEGDASILEIYVFNEDEGSLYVHHDVILPSIPLTMEWLNYDPSNVNVAGNLCAVGYMSPIIQVWDLDLVNTIVPAYKLGRKRNLRKNREAVGHKDAVLDLSWNTNLTHILASGSVDETVILWDLETKTPNMSLKNFAEKVQSVVWHPFETSALLTGSADKTCKLWDCRSENLFKSWSLPGEVEKVCWNNSDHNYFISADNQGNICYIDQRSEQPLWTVKAYDSAITGLSLSPVIPGLLVSVAESGSLKVWDLDNAGIKLVAEKALKIGATQCLDFSTESPFTLASGGDYRSRNFIVQSLLDIEAVKTRFGSRPLMEPPKVEGVPDVAGPSLKVKEKRERSSDRGLNVKKQKKKLKNNK